MKGLPAIGFWTDRCEIKTLWQASPACGPDVASIPGLLPTQKARRTLAALV